MSIPDIRLSNIAGVWKLIYLVSMWSAEERGSEMIDLVDMIKGIYVIDLEHVSEFWKSGEGLSNFISDIKLEDGSMTGYVNRTFYIVQNLLALRESAGASAFSGRLASILSTAVLAAQNLALSRKDSQRELTSRDLLFSACIQDAKLSATLQQTGLEFEKLKAVVLGFRNC